MRGLIIGMLEFILSVVLILFVLAGALVSSTGGPALEAFARQSQWSVANEWNWFLVAGGLGALVAFAIGSIVFGFLFVLLDIRAQLVQLNARQQ